MNKQIFDLTCGLCTIIVLSEILFFCLYQMGFMSAEKAKKDISFHFSGNLTAIAVGITFGPHWWSVLLAVAGACIVWGLMYLVIFPITMYFFPDPHDITKSFHERRL